MTTAAEPAEALRSRQTELTRRVIVEALADLVVEEGVHAFSVREVAERAGVSQRTVYNHFPNRQALLDGLAEVIDEEFARHDIPDPETLDDLRTVIPPAVTALAEMDRMVQAYVMLAIGARTQARVREERTARVAEILGRDLGASLDEAVLPAVTGIVRLLFSATAYYQLVHDHGVDVEQAGRAVDWALNLVLDDLESGNGPDLGGSGGSPSEEGET